eukprot:2362117-Alexandrium_andersonii.AAC.1
MSASLVGSEMCIRDRSKSRRAFNDFPQARPIWTARVDVRRSLLCWIARAALVGSFENAELQATVPGQLVNTTKCF